MSDHETRTAVLETVTQCRTAAATATLHLRQLPLSKPAPNSVLPEAWKTPTAQFSIQLRENTPRLSLAETRALIVMLQQLLERAETAINTPAQLPLPLSLPQAATAATTAQSSNRAQSPTPSIPSILQL